jgi:hypothetical protein
MGQHIDCPAPGRYLSHYLRRAHRSLHLAMLCAACMLQFASEASAQCAARHVLQGQLPPKKVPSAEVPMVKSAAEVPAWKRITLGTFQDSFALRNALDLAGCTTGALAAQILARPDFLVSSRKADVELVAISAADLGFKTETVTLAAIYARARQLGFGVAAAEIGPQLRLQYFDQPVGEFLVIGMEPIKTWSGEPVILSVVNGGTGLVLIGQNGGPDAEVSLFSRVIFLRKPADELGREAAFLPLESKHERP